MRLLVVIVVPPLKSLNTPLNSHLAGLYQISGSEDSSLVEFYLGCLHHDKQGMYDQQFFFIAINLIYSNNQFDSSSVKLKTNFHLLSEKHTT